MQTGRNAAECLRRYRGRPGQRRDWTAEEETLLKEGVKMFGMNWQSSKFFSVSFLFHPNIELI